MSSPTPHTLHPIRPDLAEYWLERWDRQQEHYLPLRTERFEVIADVIASMVTTPDPLIVDLGVGPGSLSQHLLRRFETATVIGIDADPFLLALSAAGVAPAHPSADGGSRLRLVDADLRDPSWYQTAGLERVPDAYVSTTALHWLTADQLRSLIAQCGQEIAPGGVFVDGDHIHLQDKESLFDALTIDLARAESERRGVQANEDWQQWWSAVEAEPSFAPLLDARRGRLADRGGDPARLSDYLEALSASGFGDTGVVWQYGDDRVVAGVNHPGSRPQVS